MYGYILAAALLAQSPDCEELPPFSPGLTTAIQNLAVDWEILDPREVRYVLAREEDFIADLNLLRRRYADLGDAPGAVDSQRFPLPRADINELLAFNRAYRIQIDSQMSMAPVAEAHWEYRKVLNETDHLYKIYDYLRDAKCEYYYITVRRQALKNLREELGLDNYYTGALPPHVPLWRFKPIQ
jgi:hypothetical protein